MSLSNMSVRSIAVAIPNLLRDFGRWWLREFLALFPRPVAKWLTGTASLSLVLTPQVDAIVLELVDDEGHSKASTRIAHADYSSASVDRFLLSRGIPTKGLAIGLRLPGEQVFGRKLTVPIEAAQNLDRVVQQDLIRRTPFQLAEIYHDYAAVKTDDRTKIVVWQWVARRKFVEDALQAVQLKIAQVAFIDAGFRQTQDEPAPRITLAPSGRGQERWVRNTAVGLIGAAATLAIAAVGLEFQRQGMTIEHLDRQLATARSQAEQVRTAMNELDQKQSAIVRLRSQKADEPGLLDAWNEITRVLPTHAWLVEMRLAEVAGGKDRQLTMIGLSTAASSLVSLFDQSLLFGNTALTGPISIDPVEQRERFVIQAKLRNQLQMRRAAR